jgi:tRNA(Ile)-lysidine synthase
MLAPLRSRVAARSTLFARGRAGRAPPEMTSPLSRVIGTIREHDLVPAGASVLAAVSGGSDSVALASLLRDAEQAGALRLIGLAHFDHGLRGAASDADARFCVEIAARLERPLEIGRGDVRALARARRLSLEDAARQARYAFLEEARARVGADRIAVGHTLDDQAETFLLRILRGAGTRGLAGIRPRRGAVIRPLLDCRREQLRQYLAERGLTYCEDCTNEDRQIPRNRLRHEVLPLLRRSFNPALDATLAREASIAREDAGLLDQLADEAYARVVQERPGETHVELTALGREPRPLGRRVVHRALGALAGGRFIGYDHVDAVWRVCQEGGRVDAPGQYAERIGHEVVLKERPPRARERSGASDRARASLDDGSGHPEHRSSFAYRLTVPGAVEVPESACRISATPARPTEISGVDRSALAGGGPTALVAAEALLTDGLVVRSREAGDRFRPAGLTGHQKLQDFLVNRKVPRRNRDRVPLVVDAENRIVWVAGHRLAEEFRVTDQTAGMVILKLEAWGGRA